LVQVPMVNRAKLPVTVAERLVTLVSSKLQDVLVQKHDLPAGMAADLIMQSRERATVNLFDGASENDVQRLVQQLYANSRLTPSPPRLHCVPPAWATWLFLNGPLHCWLM